MLAVVVAVIILMTNRWEEINNQKNREFEVVQHYDQQGQLNSQV